MSSFKCNTFKIYVSKNTNVFSPADFQQAQCRFRTGAGGKPSTWFPPGGLVELTPANPCTRTPEQTQIYTDTRKSRSTIPHQHPHACKQDDSAASKSKKRSGLQTRNFALRRCAPKFETTLEPLENPP